MKEITLVTTMRVKEYYIFRISRKFRIKVVENKFRKNLRRFI